MNKVATLLLCLALGAHQASARSRVVAGGLSPDKATELVVASATAPAGPCADFPEQYHYSLMLRQARTGKVLFESLEHWQTSFLAVGPHESRTVALWSADSRFVALNFEVPNHAQALRLFFVDGQIAREVPLPDYVRPVLAALGAAGAKSLVAEAIQWRGHTLKLSLSGTTSEPREATGGYDFNFSTTLEIQPQGRTAKAALSALQDNPVSPPI